MDPKVQALAAEALSRLQGRCPQPHRPLVLGALDGHCLVWDSEGLREISDPGHHLSLDLSLLIDHTLLRPTARKSEIDQLCEEGAAYGFASVCINPQWVSRCALRLAGSPIRVCTVVGFPLGASTSASKAREAQEAVENGASEVDMVLSMGHAKDGAWEAVRQDLRQVRQAIPSACLKLILETCLLSEDEKRCACRLAMEEGLDFVKTSTGFSTGGATQEDVRLMRSLVGTTLGVKASGGIRTYADALAMVMAGASRLGVSNSLAIIQGPAPARS